MTLLRTLIAAVVVALFAALLANAQEPANKIAVHASLTGSAAFSGQAYLEMVRFAVDQENAARTGSPFELLVYDDGSKEEGARNIAHQVIESDAAIVLGPTVSPLAVIACPLYAQGGMPTIDSTVHADEVTNNVTTFRTVISTGDIGEALADYLGYVLHEKRAIVLSKDNGYGRPLAQRFRHAAERLGIEASYRKFGKPDEREAAARELGSPQEQGPILLGMTYEDAVPVLVTLRRQGYRGLVLGTATMARASFGGLFADQPEERATPGFFTDGAYATSPMILDSANAEILAFADRFAARFGHAPSWESVQAFDGARLAMAAVRTAWARLPERDRSNVRARRAGVLAYLVSLNAPTKAFPALNGPIWFAPDRIRSQAVRIGRFHGGLFESAPLQLVPVAQPDPEELASGAVFQSEPGQYFRIQRVVQTGTFLNLIPRVDVAKSSFGADFYVWMRFAHEAGPRAADPADITFPNMLSGQFDPSSPAESTEMSDGTEYRLWRIQGEFRNDFDLHRFPFDRQELQLPFFNARASSERIIYVIDRRVPASTKPGASRPAPTAAKAGFGAALAAAPPAAPQPPTTRALFSPGAFDSLTQWGLIGAHERRDNLVTHSALGDLRRVGLETPRELSGFLVTIELKRRTTAALVKMLLPMLLMTVVMYATLHFPSGLTKEKVTVAVTAALSGAVFLSALNSQLGSIGYTIATEYAFYVFFALGLLCIVYVMSFETLRLGGRVAAATRVEHVTRLVFLLAVAATAGCALLYGQN